MLQRWIASWPMIDRRQGKVFSKEDLLGEARRGNVVYEYQRDSQQTVPLWGDTAVVTALLEAKGMEDGEPFDYKLWFSDTRCEQGTAGGTFWVRRRREWSLACHPERSEGSAYIHPFL
jgi:hypothetical protein